MDKFIIRIFDRDMNIICMDIFECCYQEGAEAKASRDCEWLGGYTWDVQYTSCN